MTSTPNELLKDPIFQLNAPLWLSQPLPGSYEITPLLYKQGFTLYAIGPLLSIPLDLQLIAQEARINMQNRVSPDIVLENKSDRKFAFTECKATSFSPTSSTAQQARALLVVAGPRASEVLALGTGQVSSSLLVFVMPDDECKRITQTLESLCSELDENELPSGRFCTLGLLLTDSDIRIVIDDVGSKFFALTQGDHPFIKRDPDTDPRPLYFIPYDPNVQQSRQEVAFCRRTLFERMYISVVAAVGRANLPTGLVLESQDILNDAMFGMYEHWENRDSETHMCRLCRKFMDDLAKAVNSVVTDAIIVQSTRSWKINLQDEKQREMVIDVLNSFSCETLSLRMEMEPDLLDLMDNREDNESVGGER